MNKFLKVLLNLATITTIYVVLFGVSMLLVAISDKNTPPVYPCSIEIDTSKVDEWIDDESFIETTHHINCSTLYVQIWITNNLSVEEVIALGIKLSLTKPIDNNIEVVMYDDSNSYFMTLHEDGAITFMSNNKNN